MFEIICLSLALLYIWFKGRLKYFSYFSELNIPGPKPNIFFGNLLELYSKGPLVCCTEWTKKYGRAFGYYYGTKRILFVSDSELLKKIFIKDFAKFTDRGMKLPLENVVDGSPDLTFFTLKGHTWKELRSVVTPTFSSSKMKQVAWRMSESISEMIDILRKMAETEDSIDINDIYQRLTADVITRTAFGVNLNVQKDVNCKLLKTLNNNANLSYFNYLSFVGLSFPILRNICLTCQDFIRGLNDSGIIGPRQLLRKEMKDVLTYRRNHPEIQRKDLLQLLIDGKWNKNKNNIDTSSMEVGKDEDISSIDHKSDGNEEVNKSTIPDELIEETSTTALTAGFRPASATLTFATYLLAKHQNVQVKLFNEIEDHVLKGFDMKCMSTINQLHYLDAIISETLRLYPTTYRASHRIALENVAYDSIKIPKDTIVYASPFVSHHDPTYWKNPEDFIPERFDTKPNEAGIIYFPFGLGPRNCLGMRFAQQEIKLALVQIIYNFKLRLVDPMKNVNILLTPLSLVPKDVFVRLESRSVSEAQE